MTKRIAAAGNTVAPAVLALEGMGFAVRFERNSDSCEATRGDEQYLAADPVELLGLVKLVEMRGWDWAAADDDLEDVMRRHDLEGREG
jgi:hypothetical protein